MEKGYIFSSFTFQVMVLVVIWCFSRIANALVLPMPSSLKEAADDKAE